jgi:flagellar hook assembly protein FlgD
LRRTLLALAASLLLLAAFAAPGASAATAAVNPKVVIVVGATHSATPSYRTDADAIATEALKYTTNVVKVYSPNATWSAVKSKAAGASILIYLGHGNGWPSPYAAPDSTWSTKDGFGLNETAGNGDYNNKYYGEPYVSQLALAPNAVVILNHLCYASGNSEPGNAEPSKSVAMQRADNYITGFMKAGAAAVIASGHMSASYYVRALFTTHHTIDQLWRTAPDVNGHIYSFASYRTPGATVEQDPETTTSGWYRSVGGKLSTTSEQVTGARYADTGIDPTSFVVPGAATAKVDGTPLFATATLTGTPVATVSAATHLRLDAQAGSAPDGSTIFALHALDGSVSGFAAGSSLVPRDSAGPQLWTTDAGDGALSPNGDGSGDSLTLALRFSENVAWRVRFTSAAGDTLAQSTGTGSTATATWDGKTAGVAVPEGTYGYVVTATDAWGNAPLSAAGAITVDLTAPALDNAVTFAPSAATPTISPNGDGQTDTLGIGYDISEAGYLDVTIRNAAGTTVRAFSTRVAAGTGTVSWGGETTSGATAPDGVYSMTIRPRDLAGNLGPIQTGTVAVYRPISASAPSRALFFPQDGDAYSRSTTVGFTLASAATITWTIVDATGTVVRTRYNRQALPAGTYAFAWNGKTDSGTWAPRGWYRAVATATNGSLTQAVTSTKFLADAFRITVSDTTPARGQYLTVTAVTAEGLSRNPRLVVYQPGIVSWSATMTKVRSTTYRVRIHLKASGTGTLRLKVVGVDDGGHTNSTARLLPLH